MSEIEKHTELFIFSHKSRDGRPHARLERLDHAGGCLSKVQCGEELGCEDEDEFQGRLMRVKSPN